MTRPIKYVLDIDEHLMSIDRILDKFLPLQDRELIKFNIGSRYPVDKPFETKSQKLSSIPYHPWICVDAVVTCLNMLIYRFIDNDIFRSNRLLPSGGKDLCEFVDCEIEYVFYNRFPFLEYNEFEFIDRLINDIFKTYIKPFTRINTNNIWKVEEKPTNILLVDYGNVYEYRYNEIKAEGEVNDLRGVSSYGRDDRI